MRRALAVTLLLLLPRAASAQETPRFGLVVAFPAAAGVTIRISDRLAIRPMVGASKGSTETTTTITIPILFPADTPRTTTQTTTFTSWTVTADVSGILYLAAPDAFRMYVSPRFVYNRGTSTSPSVEVFAATTSTTTTTTTTTNSSYGVSGSFGAQYTLGQRFAVFGEAGPIYRWSPPRIIQSAFSRTEAKTWSVGIQSGVGVIVYFGS